MKNTVAGRTKLSIAVSVALGAGLLGTGFAPAALAQQVAQATERVEVTGTRLPSISLEGPSPVTVLTAQDIKTDGLAKTEDLLNNLPQVFADQGSNASNGSTGTSNVNLRGLAPVRSLVLVNGRRLPPGSPIAGGYAADLNQIPAPLIQRVELLTGGASGVYGSDAVAGVVNFIMNDKFEGLQFNVNHSFYNHGQGNPVSGIVAARAVTNPRQFVVPGDVTSDGEVNDVSVLMGGNFASGRGNATVFFQYKKEDPVLEASRDFSACALDFQSRLVGDPVNPPEGFVCGGSSTSFPGRFILDGGNDGSRTLDSTPGLPPGTTRAYRSALDQFNYAPYNYYRRPSEKYAFNAFAHYDIFKEMRLYTELGFHDDHTVAQIAPSGLFFFDASGANTIHFENPFLSNDWKNQIAAANAGHLDPVTGLPAPLPFAAPGDTGDMLIARRNIEGGGRQDDLRHTSYRSVFGIKGEMFKNWNYDISMQSGRVIFSRSYRNELLNSRIGRALDVVTDPGTGQPVCRAKLNGTDPNCVPYNPWVLGGPTGAALAYLSQPLVSTGYTQQVVRTVNISSDLGNYGIKLPAAKNGVAVSFGAESRIEKLSLTTDTTFSTGDGAGQGAATIGRDGKLQVGEYFGEIRIPLIEGRQMADVLSVNANYRHSKYSIDKKTNTYGYGVEWAPVKAFRLRGTYNRAVRAPNINELYSAVAGNLSTISDPCGPNPTATLAQCQNSGITAAQYGNPILTSPAGQYNVLQGGNTNLIPEKADSHTIGLVFQPLKNLSGTVDFWSIKVADTVGIAPAQVILNQCVFNNQFCNRVTRDRLGTLWVLPTGFVSQLNDNLGSLKTTGIDFSAHYSHMMGAYGSLGLTFNGTYLSKLEQEPIKGLGKYDCKGLYGTTCTTPSPKWRHKFRANWTTPWNVDVALTWRHIDSVMQDTTSGNPLLAGDTYNLERKLDKRDYLDIAASWTLNKTFTLRGGINNLTDKDPPIISSTIADPAIFGNGNTFPQVYDTLGRLVFINLQAKF